MQLNPKQEEAKNKVEGPLLIIAGAGSWKTATLTKRVEYMIAEKNINPREILMVTFTNKAAWEMKERVAKTLWVDIPRNMYSKGNFPLLGTFHSIWIFILKEVISMKNPMNISYDEITEYIGLRKDFIIYDESDKLSVIKSIMKNQLQLDEKEFPARQIAFYISNAKNALISAEGYSAEVDSTVKEVVYSVYKKYEENLSANNALDFDDILVKTLKLIQVPKIQEYYQERYKYLMIDEYQDTNASQYQIVKLLASKYRNLAVVGDDSQSIYSWRGADMTNIINFKKDYPEALIVKLEQNYRSTKTIIAWANAVIANNTTGIKKELWTDNSDWEKINYIEAPDDKIEASVIAGIIEKKGLPYKGNLILYRTNAQSRQIEESLIRKNIPYRVIGGQKFYDRKEIKDLLAYLRVIHNRDDVVSMKRIINTPTRKIGAKSIETLDMCKDNFGLNYPDLIANIEEVEELKPAARKAITEFGIIFDNATKASNAMVVSQLIREILTLTKYEDYICEWLSEEEKQAKRDNIDELVNVATEYNGMEPRESLAVFLEEVALITDMDSKDERADYVTLMTIHTSKGLEEKRVFVTGLEDGIFPSFRSVWDAQALEEERRLMYVAMTRAREELFISRATERFHFGDYVRNPVSRFMKEIPEDHLEDLEMSDYMSWWFSFWNSQPSSSWNFTFWWASPTARPIIKAQANNDVSLFAKGDRVSHPKFGWWIITDLTWEIAAIAFTGKWVKKMNIRIAPVRKV